MENPNHLNDPNVPEGDQAHAAPDRFAPQWIDPEVAEEVMDDDDDWEDDVEWLLAPVTPPRATVGEQVGSRVDTYSSGQMAGPGQDEIVGLSLQVQTLQMALHGTELQNQQLWTRVAEMESHVGILMSYMLWMEERLTVLEKRLPGPPSGPRLILVIANSTLSFPFLFIILETFPCVLIDDVTLTKSKEESVNHGTQAQKYIENGCKLFLAQVTKQGSKEKRLEDVPVIRDFPEVFPDKLPGLPPPRQVEFCIDLIHGATLVARVPYRLAPSKMKEFSEQLRELSEKGFIRPSSSPFRAP
nr:putative reverse transcriptase domain-containing protein [Tanacetum cinerariifolium]